MEIITTKEKILSRISSGYNFDINRYLKEGWELFARAPAMFIVFTLLYFVAGNIISVIDPRLSIISSFVLGPIATAGYFTAADTVKKKGTLEFSDFFTAMDRIGHLILLQIVVFVLAAIGFALLILPGIWLMVALMFSFPLVVLSGLSFIDGIEVSIRVINKKWFNFLLLGLLAIAILLAGAILCGVGVLAAVPVMYCMFYSCFTDVLGTNDDGLKVEDHLVSDI